MKLHMLNKHRKFIGGMAACAVLATGIATAADSPATELNRQGSGAARLSGNSEDARLTDTLNPDSATRKSTADMPKDAKSFVKEAMEGNAAEVALAQVAERKAQNQQLKQFAQTIRQDHSQANQQLQPLAQKHGLTTTPTLSEKHQKKMDRLQALSGAEFDREYAKEMLRDHHKDVAKYEHASKNITDADLQQYVQATLPKLRQHLQHAQQTARAVGVDQATISSLTQGSEAMGGTADEQHKVESQHSGSDSNDKKD